MDTTNLKLAQKLLEVFSWEKRGGMRFEGYWPLVGPVETFAEQAVGELE